MDATSGNDGPTTRTSLATRVSQTPSSNDEGTTSSNPDSVVPLLSERSSEPRNKQLSTTISNALSEKTRRDTHSGLPSGNIRKTVGSWALEITAVLLSVGSVVAIAAVLRRQDSQPLSKWSFTFTLNTVIATLGTLARTTLAFALSACIGQQKWAWLRRRSDTLVAFERFDEASRGPWGATRLFFWLRLRHWASLGALVIIGTVVFDPFLQAVISNYGQLDDVLLALDNETFSMKDATIAVAQRIDGGVIIKDIGPAYMINTTAGEMTYMGGMVSRPDFGVVSSIYNGFQNTTGYRNEGGSNTCTTGNCTWPVFASAAFCSSCNDVSSHLKRVSGSGPYGSNNFPPYMYKPKGNYTAYTLPYANISNYDSGIFGKLSATWMSANLTFDPLKTVSFQKEETFLLAFAILRAPKSWLSSNDSWITAERPTATECALYLCAKAYESLIKNNKLKETVLESWALREPDSYQADLSTDFILGPGRGPWAADFGLSLDDNLVPRTDLQLRIPDETSRDFPESMQRSFNVSYAFIRSTMDFFFDITRSVIDKQDMIAYPVNNPAIMPPMVEALWYSPNLSATFETLADSLTNQFRNTSPQMIKGSLRQWVIHVQVDWQYFAVPATMITIGMIYVLLTIVESTRLRLPIWKERALPTLLYGLTEEAQSLLRHDYTQKKGSRPRRNIRFAYDEKDDCMRLTTG